MLANGSFIIRHQEREAVYNVLESKTPFSLELQMPRGQQPFPNTPGRIRGINGQEWETAWTTLLGGEGRREEVPSRRLLL